MIVNTYSVKRFTICYIFQLPRTKGEWFLDSYMEQKSIKAKQKPLTVLLNKGRNEELQRLSRSLFGHHAVLFLRQVFNEGQIGRRGETNVDLSCVTQSIFSLVKNYLLQYSIKCFLQRTFSNMNFHYFFRNKSQ